VQEAVHAGVDDLLGLDHRLLARFHAGLDDLGEVVDRIQEDVVEFGDLGLDVARHGQIDHHHRPVAARLDRALDHAQADDRQGRGRTGHDHVEARQRLADLVDAHGACAETLGQRLAALFGAVGHRHRLRPAPPKWAAQSSIISPAPMNSTC
jgi:hypothetical protein